MTEEIDRKNREPRSASAEQPAPHVPSDSSQSGNREEALEVLRRLREEDDDGEQEQTLRELIDAMNETRRALGQPLHFPPELRGKTW